MKGISLCLALFSSLVVGQESVTFTASCNGASAGIGKVILDSYGSSHAQTTLRQKWRDHFATTVSDIGNKFVRFHGLLDDDMSAFLKPWGSNAAMIFESFDYILSLGARPLVELSFMPEALAHNASSTVFHYKGGISLPANWGDWSDFITGITQLLVDRYGLAEVSQWLFEVWNEPDCGFLDAGGPPGCGPDTGNKTAYFELYQYTAEAVKAVSSSLRVGGPATAQLAWVPDFINFTMSNAVPVDFVSSHLYPTDPLIAHGRNTFLEAINDQAVLAAAAGLPFYLTEFNGGLGVSVLGGSSPCLDTSYGGAFLLHHHLLSQAAPAITSMSWWTFTDAEFEEQGANPLPYDNKFGQLNMYGVPKPTYRAAQFIAQQPTTGAAPVQPTSGGGGVQLLNAHGGVIGATASTVDVSVTVNTIPGGGVASQVSTLALNYNMSDAVEPNTVDLAITFSGLSTSAPLPTQALVEVYDANTGNPYAIWVAAGKPLYPNATEIQAEMAASVSAPVPISLVPVGGTPGAVVATISLLPYAFARITFNATI